MLDIKGVQIEIGDLVKSTQPAGGLLNPAPPSIGTVCLYKLSYQIEPVLAICYKRYVHSELINCYVLLDGKINEVLTKF